MSSTNSVYHFLIRKGGSEEEHRVLSVVRSISEHRAFSSSRVTVAGYGFLQGLVEEVAVFLQERLIELLLLSGVCDCAMLFWNCFVHFETMLVLQSRFVETMTL